jgi:hypothetical protein
MAHVQHFNVTRSEHACPLDNIPETTLRRTEDDFISSVYPLELSEMSVPVARDSDVSDFARQPSPLYVANAFIESSIVRALEQSIRELQTGNLESSENTAPRPCSCSGGTSLTRYDGFLAICPRHCDFGSHGC